MVECIFCRIVKGLEQTSVVFSDETVMAFMDIRPVNPGHLLIIPKTHLASLSELDEETGACMFKVAMRLAQAVRQSGVKCEGINLLLSDGEAAFQEVFHIHLHIIPRFKGDAFSVRFGRKYGLEFERAELDKIALNIRKVMGETI